MGRPPSAWALCTLCTEGVEKGLDLKRKGSKEERRGEKSEKWGRESFKEERR